MSQVVGGNTTLYRVNRYTDPYTLNALYTITGNFNGLSYNPADNYQYILSSTGSEVRRLGAAGSIATIPVTPTVTGGVNIGAINAQGTMFVGQDSTLTRITGISGASGTATTVTAIQSDPSPRAGYTAAGSFLVGDFAVATSESTATSTVLYGTRSVEGGTVYLYRIRVTNPNSGTPAAFVSRIATTLPTNATFGSFWVDSNGRMFTFNNNANADQGLYRIDAATGAATNLNGAGPVSASDGASCPTAPPLTEPVITLRKITSNAVGGPFTFALTNVGQPTGTVTTTAQGTAMQVDGDTANAGLQPFTVGAFTQPVTITETPPASWAVTAIQCTDNGVPVGTRSGNSYTIPGALMVSNKEFVCTFTNRQSLADLAITKTNTIAQGNSDQANDTVATGPTTYTIRVTNNGPDSVTGAVVTDAPTAGLNCDNATTVTITGNGVPAGTFTVGQLMSPGITLGTLAINQTAVLTFTCTVT